MNSILKNIGISIPEILLPAKDIDMTKWSVIACDQYTSNINYWRDLKNFINASPSTLNLIYPEVYLESESESERETRISKIKMNMDKYTDEGIIENIGPGFILIDRQTPDTVSRKGLLLSVDLDKYDFSVGSHSLIRATECTVTDRLPPRIKIRQNASLELPHVMLLIDDPKKTIIEALFDVKENFTKVYDFDLSKNGGHVNGYIINSEEAILHITTAFANLAAKENFILKYGVPENTDILLFAVGDGNHSLATAKVCWDNIKQDLSDNEIENHPARYALVEVINIHDRGLQFEPIHRVLFNVDPYDLIDFIVEDSFNISLDAHCINFVNFEDMKSNLGGLSFDSSSQVVPYVFDNTAGAIIIKNPENKLATATLQNILDEYIKLNPKAKIDYIHGEDTVIKLGNQQGNIGFFLPVIDKSDFFKAIILDGIMPRKTFSMGEADEKRFYLESKKIINT